MFSDVVQKFRLLYWTIQKIYKNKLILSLHKNSFYTFPLLPRHKNGEEYSGEYLHLQHFLASFVLHESDFCAFCVSFFVVRNRAFYAICKIPLN